MTNPVTIIAPIKLLKGKSEADLLAASEKFQVEFVNKEPGVLRRELVKKPDGSYLDIVQMRSEADVADIMEKEKKSAACGEFFALMDSTEDEADIEIYKSLATY